MTEHGTISQSKSAPVPGGLRWRPSRLLRKPLQPVLNRLRTASIIRGADQQALVNAELPLSPVQSSDSQRQMAFHAPRPDNVRLPEVDSSQVSTEAPIQRNSVSQRSSIQGAGPEAPPRMPTPVELGRRGILRYGGKLISGTKGLVLRKWLAARQTATELESGGMRQSLAGDIKDRPAPAGTAALSAEKAVATRPPLTQLDARLTSLPAQPSKAATVLVYPSSGSGEMMSRESLSPGFAGLHRSRPSSSIDGPMSTASVGKPPPNRIEMLSGSGPSQGIGVRRSMEAFRSASVLLRRPSVSWENDVKQNEDAMATLLAVGAAPTKRQNLPLAPAGGRTRPAEDIAPSTPALPSPTIARQTSSGSREGRRVSRRIDPVKLPLTPVRQAAASNEIQAQAPAISRQADQPGSAAASTSSSPSGGESGPPDITKLKGWEIEFLSAKVFSYVKRKLEIEGERNGRFNFNPWL